MHVPYMRVAIYALTFMTYAYTGYGANIITTLRDAIIAAEAVFGDVFQNAINVAKKFKIVHEVFDAAVDENCLFKCPGGGLPTKNKFHTPSANGCGSLGLGIPTEYLPITEMSSCCDGHDICYDTCNSDKELCDLDFKRCLYKYCDTYEKSAVGGEMMVKGCKGAAKMLFTGTLTLGCRSYLDAQAKSCFCPGATSKNAGADPKSNSYSNQKNNKYNAYENTQGSSGKQDSKAKQHQTPPSYGWKDKKDL